MMWNPNLMDNLNVASFYIGLKNLQENLSQSDKDDLIRSMSKTNKELLEELEKDIEELEKDIEEQNAMLRDIITRLDRIKKGG